MSFWPIPSTSMESINIQYEADKIGLKILYSSTPIIF